MYKKILYDTYWSLAAFLGCLKQFKIQFELIYEFEKHIDQAVDNFNQKEQKESKLRKEIKKSKKVMHLLIGSNV